MDMEGHKGKINKPNSTNPTSQLISCYIIHYVHEWSQPNAKFCTITSKKNPRNHPKKKKKNETCNLKSKSKSKKLHRCRHRHGIRKLALTDPLSVHRLSPRFGSHRNRITHPLLLLLAFLFRIWLSRRRTTLRRRRR